jgi:hypothetical protein
MYIYVCVCVCRIGKMWFVKILYSISSACSGEMQNYLKSGCSLMNCSLLIECTEHVDRCRRIAVDGVSLYINIGEIYTMGIAE